MFQTADPVCVGVIAIIFLGVLLEGIRKIVKVWKSEGKHAKID